MASNQNRLLNFFFKKRLFKTTSIKKNQNIKKMKKIIFLIFSCLIINQAVAQKGNYASVNGVKLYYETHGQGEPLVLLHQFTSSHIVWEQWVDSLSQNYKLIIPDLRGHGNSTNPSNVFTHAASAKDIYALMDQLKIDKFKAIGASSGGMTLVHMATMDSARITSMILVGAAPHLGKPARKIMKSSTFETVPKDWKQRMKTQHPGGDNQIKTLLHQFNGMANSYDDMNFTAPYLSQIKCPTLIIHGENDAYFPLEIPFEMSKAIPKASLWIIPDGGHLPIWDPLWADKFLEVSQRFLSQRLNGH